MLNSTTTRGRQTQTMRARRAIGEMLMPTLVRLAECSDRDIASSARATVMALYGGTLHPQTKAEMQHLTIDELETALDVMGTRGVEPNDVCDYLTLYLGPRYPLPATSLHRSAPRVLMGNHRTSDIGVGFDALARLRDSELGSRRSDVARLVLLTDMLDRFPLAARASLEIASDASIRGLLDEIVEHDVADHLVPKLVESVMST